MKIISSLLALTLLLSPAMVNAGLIDNDTFTTDDVSGLDWLDLRSTKGLSYDEVETSINGGNLSGWRFATSLEFDELVISHLGFEPDNYFSGRQYDGFASLIDLLGSTYSKIETINNAVEETVYAVAYVDSSNVQLGQPRQFGFGYLGGYFRPSDNPAFIRSKDSGVGSHASFLVRDNAQYQTVPASNGNLSSPAMAVSEPSHLALFSFMLLALLRVKRR